MQKGARVMNTFAKVTVLSIVIACVICLLSGCGGVIVDLPEEPLVFEMTEREGVNSVILKNGDAEYAIYGKIKSRGLFDLSYAFGDCIGYVSGDKNDRLFELKGESRSEWLIRYYVNGVMDQPVVLRRLPPGQETVPACVVPDNT